MADWDAPIQSLVTLLWIYTQVDLILKTTYLSCSPRGFESLSAGPWTTSLLQIQSSSTWNWCLGSYFMFYRHDWRGGIDHNCAAKLPSAIFTGYTWKHRCELVRRSGVCGAGRPRRGLEESGIEEASRSSQRWVKLRWWYVWECKRFIFNNRFDQKKLLVSFTCQPTSGQVRPPKSVFLFNNTSLTVVLML